MTTLNVQVDDKTKAALDAVAANSGSQPEQVAAALLRDVLADSGDEGTDSLQAKRSLSGALADRYPWNNAIDAEWDNFQP